MSFVFRIVAMVPAALRAGTAGGAVYGTAKLGVWSDSSESKEKLDRLRTWTDREIQYPKGGVYPFLKKPENTSVLYFSNPFSCGIP